MGVSALWLVMLASGGGGIGLPLGVPPLPADPVLANVAPEECLLYCSSAGMAIPDPKSTNPTERLFAEPEVQRLAAEAEKLVRTALKEAAHGPQPEARALAESGPTLVKVLLTRPLAVYVKEAQLIPKGPPRVRAGMVVSLGEDADKVRDALQDLAAVIPAKARDVTVAGTTFHQLTLPHDGPEVTWGVKEK
jgi:hypothetical protein